MQAAGAGFRRTDDPSGLPINKFAPQIRIADSRRRREI
jgi:hypothetical protein